MSEENLDPTPNHSMAAELSSSSESSEPETVNDVGLKKDESLSDVDSDWDEEDIQLLRLLKDPKRDLKLWPNKLLSRNCRDDLYLAKVRQILNDVKDWKKIHDLLMEDFRNDSVKIKMKKDLVDTRGELSSLKKAHRETLKRLAEREESYQEVCDERDTLQQRVSYYEERLEKVSKELQVTQQDKQMQQDQEKQRLQNQVISLEGEKAKLERFKLETEKLRSQKQALMERNKGLQEECQRLSNQLRQVSEGDMVKLSVLDQVISANKEQISVLQNERDDLERKNFEQILSTSSIYCSRMAYEDWANASLLLSPEDSHIDKRGRSSLSKDGWNQHPGMTDNRVVSGEPEKDISITSR